MVHFALVILAIFFAPIIFNILVGWSIAVIFAHFWQYIAALILIILAIVLLIVGAIWTYAYYEGFFVLAIIVIPIIIVVLTIKKDKNIAKKEAKVIAERQEAIANQEVIEIESRANMTQEELTIEFKDYVLDLSDDYWVNNYEEYAKWYREMMKRKSDRRI